MHKFLITRWHGLHMWLSLIVLIVLDIALMHYEWILGIIGFILTGVVVYYTMRAEKVFRDDLHEYIMTLSHRVKHAGNAVIHELPIGIILYSEDQMIDWHNPYVAKLFGNESIIGDSLADRFPDVTNRKDEDGTMQITIGDRIYEVLIRAEERLLYIQDMTDYAELSERYEAEKIAIGIVALDNLDEVTQGMEDQAKAVLVAEVTSEINEWAHNHQIYLRGDAPQVDLVIVRPLVDLARDFCHQYRLRLILHPLGNLIQIIQGDDADGDLLRFVSLGQFRIIGHILNIQQSFLCAYEHLIDPIAYRDLHGAVLVFPVRNIWEPIRKRIPDDGLIAEQLRNIGVVPVDHLIFAVQDDPDRQLMNHSIPCMFHAMG